MEVDSILQDAITTAERLNAMKRRDVKYKKVSVDGLLKYCETVESLCNEIKKLKKKKAR